MDISGRLFQKGTRSQPGAEPHKLGQAALNIAAHAGAHVIATTRNAKRLSTLEALGAKQALLEAPHLSRRVRELHPNGIDAVLELVGNTTLFDSFAMVRRHGRVCEAGFLGGLGPIESFNPLLQMPSGVHFSFFGSFMFGSPEFPLSDIPFQKIFERVADGTYQANLARTFRFEEIQDSAKRMSLARAKPIFSRPSGTRRYFNRVLGDESPGYLRPSPSGDDLENVQTAGIGVSPTLR